MADLTTLQALKARVEAASGPDEGLAIAINEALDIASYITDDGDPTASIDAALALVERVLPRWSWSVDTMEQVDQMPDGWAWATVRPGDALDWAFYRATAPTPPLAICAALLSALIAKEQTHAE